LKRPRALDLFCGGGGVSEGLLLAGFDVVGVDLDPKRERAYMRGPGNPERHENPAVFVQADALAVLNQLAWAQRGAFAPLFEEPPFRGGFDFIWASPPCQKYSGLRHLVSHRGEAYPDLVGPTRELLVAAGIPYAIENVPGAPLGGFLSQLCGTMFGLQTPDGRAELRRHRLFETSWPIALRPACQHGHESLTVTGHGVQTDGMIKRRRAEAGRVITVTGDRPNAANTPRVICVAGGKAMSGGMMTPQGMLKQRAALSISGHAVETSQKQDRNTRRRAISITGNTPQTNLWRNVVRETFSTDDARHAMGISWMAMKDLSQAIPPAYAEWVGQRALEEIAAQGVISLDPTGTTA
jgi:hypothetical protein